MRNRLATVLAALTMALGAVLVFASPAAAVNDYNESVDATWNTDHSKECVDHIWVDACVQPYGDIIWIKDNYADDRSVGVLWEDLDGPREGRCYDFLGAARDWTACNKDFPEGHRIRWTVGYVNLETNAWEWEAYLLTDTTV